MHIRLLSFITFLFLLACEEKDEQPPLTLVQAFVGNQALDLNGVTDNLPTDRSISISFSSPVDRASAQAAVLLRSDQGVINTSLSFSSDDKTILIFPEGLLTNNTLYTIDISSDLTGASGQAFPGRQLQFRTSQGNITIVSAGIAGMPFPASGRIVDVPLGLSLTLTFSAPLDQAAFSDALSISGASSPGISVSYSDDDKTATITAGIDLLPLRKYTLQIAAGVLGAQGQPFVGFSREFYTEAGHTPVFPVISDEELLTKVQSATFKYFWDFAHPVSGLARERNTSGDVVTIGGSGFGVMSILVGIERGFITRQQGIARLMTIVNFLAQADRFHGVWPHWMHGATGATVPFSTRDDGGDLVETAFMIQGLLTVREYLNQAVPEEKEIMDKITQLWREVEWTWYTKGGENVLYWHWSPNYNWEMNLPIRGYNESLIVYVLAAASPTFPIDKAVYTEGWARNGAIENGQSYFGVTLPVGYEFGGPLFFAHYSFLGLDPRNLEDTYANYWTQNQNHTLINRAYCIENPKRFAAYGENSWGLTASDNPWGYSAHSPTNDLGVITPTAALSSFPYTPDESMEAMKFFYYILGDRLWGDYGFYDAFNATENWYADSYLAIDQGPIILMIENHRTGLLWKHFMANEEVWLGLDKLGFTSYNKP
jgi:hypothetical protein